MTNRPTTPATASAGERLSKRVAQLGSCSRRDAEHYIEGRLGADQLGQVVEEPMARVTDQTITIDPQATLMALTEVTLLLPEATGL